MRRKESKIKSLKEKNKEINDQVIKALKYKKFFLLINNILILYYYYIKQLKEID